MRQSAAIRLPTCWTQIRTQRLATIWPRNLSWGSKFISSCQSLADVRMPVNVFVAGFSPSPSLAKVMVFLELKKMHQLHKFCSDGFNHVSNGALLLQVPCVVAKDVLQGSLLTYLSRDNNLYLRNCYPYFGLRNCCYCYWFGCWFRCFNY